MVEVKKSQDLVNDHNLTENKFTFTETMLDNMAWARRAHSFGDDFVNYLANYFVKIKGCERLLACIHAQEMHRKYFLDSDRNMISLWQDYISDKNDRDAIISLLNGEFDFDMVYFEKGVLTT